MRLGPSPSEIEVRRLIDAAIRDPLEMLAMSTAELDLTLRVARRARLLGRLAHILESAERMGDLPEIAVDQLNGAKAMADARGRLAFWELNRIEWALDGEVDAPLIVLKGCAYSLLSLPNAPGRLFADVDLLTSEESLETVEAALNARGWQTMALSPYDQNYYRNWTHELPPLVHEEREVEIDLHHNVLPRTARLKPTAAKLLERTRPLPGSTYRVFCDEDLVLHTMTHLMFDADLDNKIRDLVDIHDMVQHFATEDDDFWRRWLDRAVEMDLTRPAYYALRYSSTLLGTHVPRSVQEETARWAPPRPIVWLMDSIVPRTLYPQHPDAPNRMSSFCRLLLYIRSHWIRMPPWLLVYHIGYKTFVTRIMPGARQNKT